MLSLYFYGQMLEHVVPFYPAHFVCNVDVVRSVANYAVTYGRSNSPLGRNAMFCMHRYNCTLDDILYVLYNTKIEDVVHFFI